MNPNPDPKLYSHIQGKFPFNYYFEGDKPYTGTVKEHPKFNQLILVSITLTMCGGFINAIAIFDLYHYALTHLSGLTSTVAIRVVTLNPDVVTFLADICMYGVGALFAGFLTAHNKHTLGRHFAIGFFIEGSLLLLVSYLLINYPDSRYNAQFIICFSVGLQNGMTSTYSNNVMRTTHITGMINDTFMLVGYWIRTRNIRADFWRLKVFFPIWLGFLVGSGFGTWAYINIGDYAFIVPGLYALFWCAVITAMRGCKEPKQKYQIVIETRKNQGPSPNQPPTDKDTVIIPVPLSNTDDAMIDFEDQQKLDEDEFV